MEVVRGAQGGRGGGVLSADEDHLADAGGSEGIELVVIGSHNRRLERFGERYGKAVGERDAADGAFELACALPERPAHRALDPNAQATPEGSRKRPHRD